MSTRAPESGGFGQPGAGAGGNLITSAPATPLFTPQPIYSGYGGSGLYSYYSPSTAAESYFRGQADVIRAWGEYNERTADAATRLEQARRAAIENRSRAIQAYFDARAYNRQAVAAESPPRKSREFYAQLATVDAPRRLASNELDPVSGRINWPLLLRTEAGVRLRCELERLFLTRAVQRGLSTQQYLEVTQLVESLTAELERQVAVLPPREYVAAKRFMQSLAFEATLPPV